MTHGLLPQEELKLQRVVLWIPSAFWRKSQCRTAASISQMGVLSGNFLGPFIGKPTGKCTNFFACQLAAMVPSIIVGFEQIPRRGLPFQTTCLIIVERQLLGKLWLVPRADHCCSQRWFLMWLNGRNSGVCVTEQFFHLKAFLNRLDHLDLGTPFA